MDIPLYFYAAFKDMDRLAPGSDKSTLKAIGYIDFNKDSQLTILPPQQRKTQYVVGIGK